MPGSAMSRPVWAPTVTMSSTLMVRPRPSAFLIFANTATTAARMNSHAARGTASIHRPTGAGRRIGSTTPRLFISNLSATTEPYDVLGRAGRQEEFGALAWLWRGAGAGAGAALTVTPPDDRAPICPKYDTRSW